MQDVGFYHYGCNCLWRATWWGRRGSNPKGMVPTAATNPKSLLLPCLISQMTSSYSVFWRELVRAGSSHGRFLVRFVKISQVRFAKKETHREAIRLPGSTPYSSDVRFTLFGNFGAPHQPRPAENTSSRGCGARFEYSVVNLFAPRLASEPSPWYGLRTRYSKMSKNWQACSPNTLRRGRSASCCSKGIFEARIDCV